MRTAPLGELVSVSKGKKLTAAQIDEPRTRWLQIEDLRSDTKIAYAPTATPNPTIATPSDLLIAWDGANAGTVGWGLSGYVGSTLARLRPVSEIHTPYVGRFLQFHEADIRRNTTGATIPHVNGLHLKSVQIPLPSLQEQKQIAAIMDQADALRARRREQIALLDALPQAIFHEMFAGIPISTTVAEVITQKGAIRTGPFGSQLKHDEFVSSGISVIGLDNVVENIFQWKQRRFIAPEKYLSLQRYTVNPGDVLISIMGTVGKCVVVPEIETSITTKHLCAITPGPEITPAFLRASFLWSDAARAHIAQQTKGSIMAGLNMGIVRGIPLAIPPMFRQQEFSHRITAISQNYQRLQAAASASDALFASLQSRAFRGEL